MWLAELIRGLPVRVVKEAGPVRVCDVTEDSRTVMPGSLFIARRGREADGRAFVPAAIAAGAVAILSDDPALTPGPEAQARPGPALLVSEDVELATALLAERFYGEPSGKLVVIGVTGTNGKTTTSSLIHQMLNALGVRTGLIGTVSIDDGVEIAPATLTTPTALETSLTLWRMVEAGCRAAVMEVSSHALHQRRVAGLSFAVGVFTNLSGDHLDYHGTMEAYAEAKSRLFAMLGPEAVAVVNADDGWHERLVAGTRARVLRCCLEELGACRSCEPECRARVVAGRARTTVAEFSGPWGSGRTELKLVGRHNVMNALQAGAATWAAAQTVERRKDAAFMLDGARMARLLAQVEPPPGRLEMVSGPTDPVTVYVDYAHSDDALGTVLRVLRGAALENPEAGAAVWCVFGCGGDRDRSKRPRMGAVAARQADHVILTSDNPRREDPGAIVGEIMAGIPEPATPRVLVELDRERAIRLAIRRAAPGDIVLIAGKGHETYQILPDGRGGTVRRDFDDRRVAREALRLRAQGTPPVSFRRAEGAAASASSGRTEPATPELPWMPRP
ncbi:MAG TPA: UDP-N-acetylmuramoyl-L-alanyl-D-glutamate--2,6-diaminopimelate ligase [Phycisphaerales bacterium]|nr:UDP-N-acetylmuramoyl-L-alanyl-D-glutamate--2,6-diaminopimelate ligase [Phycisphaerales bacterium]